MKKMIVSNNVSTKEVESLYGKMTADEKKVIKALESSPDYVASLTTLADVLEIFKIDISDAFAEFVDDQLDRNAI